MQACRLVITDAQFDAASVKNGLAKAQGRVAVQNGLSFNKWKQATERGLWQNNSTGDTNGSPHDKVQSSKYPSKRSRDAGTSFDSDRSGSKLRRSSDRHFRSSNPHSDSHSLSRHTHERRSRLPHLLSKDRDYYHLERSRSRKESKRRRY
nr:hypothetical transcript [Hymenolepis microstoma]